MRASHKIKERKRRWIIPFLVLVFSVFVGREMWVLAQDSEEVAKPPVVQMAALTSSAEYIGAETCLACHTSHEDFDKSVHGKGLVKLKGIEFSKSCETCHGPGSLHAGAGGDKSHPDFFSIKNPKKLSASEVSETCFQCHQDTGRIYWKGSKHESRNVSCVSCHSVHEPKSSKKLFTKASEAETCYQCHKDVKAKMRRSAHMPVKEGKISCSDCHNPHGSPGEKNLKADSVTQLCNSCHADKRGPVLWEHFPVRENCLNCHDQHGSHYENMLKVKVPLLCQRCHMQRFHRSQPRDAVEIAQFDAKVVNNACVDCHSNIHGSNHPSGQYFLR